MAWCSAALADDHDELAGTWVAYPEVRGHAGELVIDIAASEEGELSGSLRLPQIQSQAFPLGDVSVDGTTVNIGPLALERDGDVLSTPVPASLLPVYEVTAEFRKANEPLPVEIERELGDTIQPAWAFESEAAIWGGALVAGNSVYFGNDSGRLFALDASNGIVRWALDTGGAIRSTPVSVGSDILFQSDDGYLYRVSASDGDTVWSLPLSRGEQLAVDRTTEDPFYDHYASSVTVSGNIGYVGTYSGDIVCFELGRGDILWRFETDGPVQGQPLISGNRIVATSWDQHVYALDARTGEELWRVDAGGTIPASPGIHNGETIFVGTRGYDLIALDLATGDRVWDHYFWFSWVDSPPFVAGDKVLASGSDGGAVLAFEAATGRKLWEFDTTGSVWAPLAARGDTIFAGAVGVRDYIVAHEPGFFAIDAQTGDPRWSFLPEAVAIDGGTRSGFAAAPAVDSAFVYAGSLDGNLYAFPVDGRGASSGSNSND